MGLFTIYKAKNSKQLYPHVKHHLNNYSYVNETSESSLERRNDNAVNQTVIENRNQNKILSDFYSTSGKKFYNNNIAYNKLIQQQNNKNNF